MRRPRRSRKPMKRAWEPPTMTLCVVRYIIGHEIRAEYVPVR